MKPGIQVEGLEVASALYDFINQEALPHSGVQAAAFWRGFSALIRDLAPQNAGLLQRRAQLQEELDTWHRAHPGVVDINAYKEFLFKIGYLVPEGQDFAIDTANVDSEIVLAGPQLVFAADNPRHALHAANARWGSLYDALYVSDFIPENPEMRRGERYNPARGAKVVDFARGLLDQYLPLTDGSHRDAAHYTIDEQGVAVKLRTGERALLRDPDAFIGYQGDADAPAALLFKHHGLHIELRIDRMHHVGRRDLAGIVDVQLEAAPTVIHDFAGAAAVDADDKVGIYRIWLGLMKGTLQHSFDKDGKQHRRKLHGDRRYQDRNAKTLMLHGRSLMMVRHVGLHVMSDAVLLDGKPVPETLIDAAVVALIGLHDLNASSTLRNSHSDSMYFVQSNLHGPDEAAFADTLFTRVEDMLGLPRHTIKLGLMDEERRTSLNLKECLRAVRQRVVMINTGFLDRLGDEIHTFMEAGPALDHDRIEAEHRLDVYERRNVEVALACGFAGKAQIGKGSWLYPERLAEMLKYKASQLAAAANTTWAFSPVSATLHALNYHDIDVAEILVSIANRPRVTLDEAVPSMITTTTTSSAQKTATELHKETHRILSYVACWVERGIGCSRIRDIEGAVRTEDRATLRAAIQHVANGLRYQVCSETQVRDALGHAARALGVSNLALQTALQLVLDGDRRNQGYAEDTLHAARRAAKAKA